MNEPGKVTLGDGYSLNAIGRGTVELVIRLPEGKRKKCKLQNTLFVPDLAYNLLSVSKVSDAGKVTKFGTSGCLIVSSGSRLIARGSKHGSLYMLDCESGNHANTVLTKEDMWHRRYGHLGAGGLRQLAVHSLVEGFDYNGSQGISFCEPCTKESTIEALFLLAVRTM